MKKVTNEKKSDKKWKKWLGGNPALFYQKSAKFGANCQNINVPHSLYCLHKYTITSLKVGKICD